MAKPLSVLCHEILIVKWYIKLHVTYLLESFKMHLANVASSATEAFTQNPEYPINA